MRLKAPLVPPAASALFQAAQGPRVLPGNYTVKMTKGDQVYTAPLVIRLDPRATFTVEDRKAQFDLATKLDQLMGHMSYGVAAIVSVRDAADARAAKLAEKDPLRAQVTKLSADLNTLRSKIVATKEGGAITGEERIREFIGDVYGDVNGYEGRPTEMQINRTQALSHELDDVITDFQKLTAKDLAQINAGLRKKKLEAISVPDEAEWMKTQESAVSPAGQAMGTEPFDRD
jgi:hypothetical protein